MTNKKSKKISPHDKENSFLLFTDERAAVESMSDEDAGKMVKAIFTYADEGIIPPFKGLMLAIFNLFKGQIDRCQKNYKETCERNRQNAEKRWGQDKAAKEQEIREMVLAELEKKGVSLSKADAYDRIPADATACLPNPNPSSNPEPDIDDGVNTPIINENKDVVEVIVEEDLPFDKIWEIYDKKVGNVAALRETWKALSADEKRKIFEYVPIYVRVRPDRKYRKNFENFLTCRTWETEPIAQNEILNGNKNYRSCPQSNEARRELAQQNSFQLVSKFLGGSDEPVACFDGGEEGLSHSS